MPTSTPYLHVSRAKRRSRRVRQDVKLSKGCRRGAEAKDKTLQARKEQIDLGNEADRSRGAFVEQFAKLLKELKRETMSDKRRVRELEDLLHVALDSCKQSLGQHKTDADGAIKRE
jgi:hypothetical protein